MKRLFTLLILTFSIFVTQAEGRPLKAKDVIKLTVFGEEKLNQTVTIDSSGSVNLPLIGNVQVIGKSTTEVETEVKTRLEEGFIKDPNVTVSVVTEYEEPKKEKPPVIVRQQQPVVRPVAKVEPAKPVSRVTVMGHVKTPGIVQFEGTSVDLLTIIAQVRGVTSNGNSKKVTIRRVGENSGVSEHNVIKLQTSTDQIFVRDGDVINVPRRTF